MEPQLFPAIAKYSTREAVTKCALVSDIAKTLDVLGWFAPVIVPKDVHVTSAELHGFSDASEATYAGVVYLRIVDSRNVPHVSLAMCKTKIAPIKRLTVPHLELCGAHLLANLLHHIQKVFNIPSNKVFAWTDSTIVLSWLVGSPHCFKTFVGNWISTIMELTSLAQWHHVSSPHNPADCASRGLFPSELLQHHLWWNGPEWLLESRTEWPKEPTLVQTPEPVEEKEICLHASAATMYVSDIANPEKVL